MSNQVGKLNELNKINEQLQKINTELLESVYFDQEIKLEVTPESIKTLQSDVKKINSMNKNNLAAKITASN